MLRKTTTQRGFLNVYVTWWRGCWRSAAKRAINVWFTLSTQKCAFTQYLRKTFQIQQHFINVQGMFCNVLSHIKLIRVYLSSFLGIPINHSSAQPSVDYKLIVFY